MSAVTSKLEDMAAGLVAAVIVVGVVNSRLESMAASPAVAATVMLAVI